MEAENQSITRFVQGNIFTLVGTLLLCSAIVLLIGSGKRGVRSKVLRSNENRLQSNLEHSSAAITELEFRSNDHITTAAHLAYEEVHVLLLSWQGADPRFHKQLVDLQNVLKEYYHYNEGSSEIEDFAIPSENSKNALDDKLSLFLQKDGSRRLLILYYGGHGDINVDQRAVWKKYEKDGPELPWHDIQTKLFERRSDILLLIDCCAAASSTVPVETKGMVEVIYASGFEGTSPLWGPHSFTTNLVAELKKVHDTGMSIERLAVSLNNSLRHQRPQQSGRQKRATPRHFWLARPEPLRSIYLRSLLSTDPIQMLQKRSRSFTPTMSRSDSIDILKLQEVKKKTEILKWLDPSDQSRFHNSRVDAKQQETGGWIFKHDLFTQWQEGKSQFLVLYGSVGCGKTVLCASIANFLEDLCSKQSGHKHRDLTARFYFSFEEFSRWRNVESLVKSLIQQLSIAPEVFSELRALYDEAKQTWPPRSPSSKTLRNLLISGLKNRCSDVSTQRNVFLIIDALDEIPKGVDRDEVIEFLKELSNSGILYLHVLVSSRPHPGITTRLSADPGIWVQLHISNNEKAAIRSDIGVYVDSVLRTHYELSELPGDVKDLIWQRLVKDQDGMFRWAKLQIGSLQRLDPATSETVKAALEKLPEDLNSTYLKLLREIDPILRPQAINALRWLCSATRPLFIEEMVEICATFPGATPGFQETKRLRPQHIAATLKDLVIVDPSLDGSPPLSCQNVIILAHSSVKEYLTGDLGGVEEVSIYKVGNFTNKFVADCCLTYLLSNNTFDKRNSDYPLRDYAWNQWAWHAVYKADSSSRSWYARRLFEYCVYSQDCPEEIAQLRTMHWIPWLPNNAASNITLLDALRTPYFYREYRENERPTVPTSNNINSSIFSPLQGGSTIRLVRLLPSEYDSPEIRCQLIHSSLDQNEGYDAVSYTWGGQFNPDSCLRINGHKTTVTAKLGGILRTLRNTNNEAVRTIWVDQICINMEDLEERSLQVDLTARIYKQAQEVAVVLGDDPRIEPRALSILDEISTLLLEDGEIPSNGLTTLLNLTEGYCSEDLWTDIVFLFSHPWWRRIWPIQEIALGTKVTIIYGKLSVNFDSFQRVMVNEKKARQILDKVYNEQEFHIRSKFFYGYFWESARTLGQLRTVMRRNGRIGLPQLLHASRYRGVSDPRDRIYAILPLSRIGMEHSPYPPVDYRIHEGIVFVTCSQHILESSTNLDILSYTTNLFGDEIYDFLPSWASTFSNAIDVDLFLVKGDFQPLEGPDLYSACGEQKTANIAFMGQGNFQTPDVGEVWCPPKLIIKGIVVDRIRNVSWYGSDGTVGCGIRQREKILQTLDGDALLLKGIGDETNIEIVWKTMVADQWEVGKRTLDECSGLPRSLSDERDLKASGKTVSGLQFCHGRCLFTTSENYVGLGPRKVREGDYVVILPGARVPYIFRPVIESSRPTFSPQLPTSFDIDKWVLVGESYVHGMMDGQMMTPAEVLEDTLRDMTII